jgi:hypothetical protein
MTGAVIYAGRNSRLKNFAYKDFVAGVRGYRSRDKQGNPLAGTKVPGQPLRLSYQVTRLTGGTMEVGSVVKLSKKKPNDAWAPATSAAPTGVFNYEEVHDAAGTAVLRHDSNGMFAVVASDLRKRYVLPKGLVRAFDNVHDDLADGGTSEDSRENFFHELGKMTGAGLDFFAYSGHGNYNGLPSAGVYMKHVEPLGDEISRLVRTDGTVMLYACSCATPGGFAQALSKRLGNRKVWAHTGAGTADKNPNMYLFQNGLDQDFLGATNFTKEERTAWKVHLKRSADFYIRFPFLTIEEMKSEMASA